MKQEDIVLIQLICFLSNFLKMAVELLLLFMIEFNNFIKNSIKILGKCLFFSIKTIKICDNDMLNKFKLAPIITFIS